LTPAPRTNLTLGNSDLRFITPPPEGGSYYCGGYSVHCRADLGPEATLLSPLSFSRPPCRRNHTFSEVPVSAGSEAAWLRKRRRSVIAGAAKASASTSSACAEVILDEGHAQDRDLLKSRCLQNQGRAPEFPSRANRAGTLELLRVQIWRVTRVRLLVGAPRGLILGDISLYRKEQEYQKSKETRGVDLG
jgi:hypothetical protein